jgi:ABC-type lipoprotein release transport system permease subunit
MMKGPRLGVMAWRNLWRRRRRTLITISSIAFGTFLAVIFTAFQDRNFADMIDLAARMIGGHVTLQHPEYHDKPTLSRSVRDTDRLASLAMEDEEVVRVVTRIMGFAMLSTASANYGGGFIAFDPEAEDEDTLSIMEGLEEGEIFATSRDQGIILGKRLAKNLGTEMGKKVVYTLTDRNGEIVSGLARVSGIVRTGAPRLDAGLCLLPIDSLREVLGYEPDEALQVAVFIDDQRKSAEVARRLQDRVGPEVAALTWDQVQPDLAGFIAMKVSGAIFMEVLIAIIVAAGIFNTLFVSVMERLREFGIMMAIGFSPGSLFRLVMLESLWLGLVGLAAGAALTVGPYLYLSAAGLDMTAMIGGEGAEVAGVAVSPIMRVGIFPEHAVFIAVAVFTATMLSGLYPAWRAGRVVPVETIKIV